MAVCVALLLAVNGAAAYTLNIQRAAAAAAAKVSAVQSDIVPPVAAVALAATLAFGSAETAVAFTPTPSLIADRAEAREAQEAQAAQKKAAAKAAREEAAEKKAFEAADRKAKALVAKAEVDTKKAEAEEAKAQASKPALAPAAKQAATAPAAVTPAKASAGKSYAAAETDLTVGLKAGAVKLDPKEIITTRDLNRIKLPRTVGVDVPVLGPVRVNLDIKVEKSTKEDVLASDIQVVLPSNLVKAGKLAIGGDAGLLLDAPGLVSGRLDLDVLTPRKGEADITVTSDIIPKIPLQKGGSKGRFCFDCGNGAPPSDWYVLRNLGNGVQFYSNPKTGVSTFETPPGF